jgi:OPA family sugar phosphate sensor protein UhpC-like MFS transporter
VARRPNWNILSPAPAQPALDDNAEVARRYRRWRWSMFLSATLGYGFYYTCRLPLSVTKSKLAAGGVLDPAQMGQIGLAHKVTYATGKLINGFLADRVHLGRFLLLGLIGSAAMNLVFGYQTAFWPLLAAWVANGWMQAHGSPTSGVIIANWFSDRERGNRYAVWSLSHHIGEALTFSGTALVVDRFGWRAGFIGPALLCAGVALVLSRTLTDRPAGLGLPPIGEHMNDPPPPPAERGASTWELQRVVLASGWIWTLALASAAMYVARYAINDWGVLYLEMEKGYSLTEAGAAVSLFPLVGALGTASCGWLSDRFFQSRRTPLTVAAALLLIASQCAFYLSPPGHPWIVRAAIGCAGIAIGALLVFLGGLTAMDLAPRRASGAALGLVGNFSYIGAAIQDWLSGKLIQDGSSRGADGALRYDFSRVKLFWIGASVIALLLGALLWLPERRRLRASAPGQEAHSPDDQQPSASEG